VNLIQVDVVRAEPPQRPLAGTDDILRRHIDLRVHISGRFVIGEAELRRDDRFVTAPFQRAAQHFLAVPGAVYVRRVEELDSEFERPLNRADRHAVVHFAVSVGVPVEQELPADRPAAEADRAHFNVRLAEFLLFHHGHPTPFPFVPAPL